MNYKSFNKFVGDRFGFIDSLRLIRQNITLALLLCFAYMISSCRKITIAPPIGTTTTSQVFESDAKALSAVATLYFNLINYDQGFANYAMTAFGGMSADELTPFDQTNSSYTQFYQNNLLPSNPIITSGFWQNAYSTIYGTNAVLAGLEANARVNDSLKMELTGECKFIRAFCYFYLTNLFGDVPLVTTINWHNTNLLSRSAQENIYNQIINDLQDAQSLLTSGYETAIGQRIIPNKWAAQALLARVYLYKKEWSNAESVATNIIDNSSLFQLDSSLTNVFLKNSNETIWQLQQYNQGGVWYSSTPEGYWLGNRLPDMAPHAYLTPQILTAFEIDDKRKTNWVDSSQYFGQTYYYPAKYKMGPSQAIFGGPYIEYYTVFRLAEQYLIRAEARAQQNKLDEGLSDLNVIRMRAGLGDAAAANQDELISNIQHERQVEFFCEWGHRWLDLKRTENATATLQSIKPNWTTNAELYPIPLGDLTTDPNLTQNPGY